MDAEPRRLLLLAAATLALALAAAPANASVVEESTQEAREDLAGAAPDTGTPLDPVIGDVLDPERALTDTDGLRDDLASHVPRTGTAGDDVVQDAIDPEGDPTLDNEEANRVRRALLTRAAGIAQYAWTLLPDDDPLTLVGDSANEITRTASGMFPDASAYEQQEPAPASGEAVALQPEIPAELIVAGGAAAAAAAALLAFWVAGSSGSLGAAGASTAGATSAELRRLLPFASPLFTRFEKDTVLGHPKREQLYAFILQDPGVSLQALCDKTGLSRTAVTHHLRLLELQHLIVSKRMGRSRHYYENGGRFGRDQKDAYAVLHNARTKDVARFVRDHPGAIQKELCAALAIQPSIAHWHLKRLQDAQLVEPVRHGRTVSYFPGPGLRTLDQPIVPRSSEPAPATVAAPLAAAPVMAAAPLTGARPLSF